MGSAGKVAAAAVEFIYAEFIYATVADNPARFGNPLRFELEGLHSARRVIYQIDDQTTHITIGDIQHRADIYHPRRLMRYRMGDLDGRPSDLPILWRIGPAGATGRGNRG